MNSEILKCYTSKIFGPFNIFDILDVHCSFKLYKSIRSDSETNILIFWHLKHCSKNILNYALYSKFLNVKHLSLHWAILLHKTNSDVFIKDKTLILSCKKINNITYHTF